MGHGQSPHHCRRSCLGPARKLVVKLAGALPCFPERPGGPFLCRGGRSASHRALCADAWRDSCQASRSTRACTPYLYEFIYIYILVVDIDMFVSLSLSLSDERHRCACTAGLSLVPAFKHSSTSCNTWQADYVGGHLSCTQPAFGFLQLKHGSFERLKPWIASVKWMKIISRYTCDCPSLIQKISNRVPNASQLSTE